MPNSELQPGLTFRRSIMVDESLTVPFVSHAFVGFADMPPVFATAFLVGLVEWTCVEGLRAYLLEGEHTVGTFIDVSHIAAPPVGMRVTAEARLLAVVGRKLRFRVSCHDEHELVAEGTHERTLIQTARFMSRAEAKRATIAPSGLESTQWHHASNERAL
jgi:fluoroacetyl-CoA thioesterase